MKYIRRYCRRCDKEILHDIKRDAEGFERLLVAAATLGFGEMLNKKYLVCQRYGKKTEVSR